MNELPDNNHDEARRWLRNVEDNLRDTTRAEAQRFGVLAESVVAAVRGELED